MEIVVLNVEPREDKGKGPAGRARREGKVPGIFYGPGKDSTSIFLNAREFRTKLGATQGSSLIQLVSSATHLNDKMVMLKEVQSHPITRQFLHIDCYEVDVNKPIEATIPLHFIGKPEGVTAGGVLQSLYREITVECLPRDIPASVEVDVSRLKIHDAIHIADLILPAGVKAVYETNVPVVTVMTPVVEEKPVETVAEGETPVEGAAAAEEAAPAKGEKR